MQELLSKIQKLLDQALYQEGITSHHLRKTKLNLDKEKVDAYVVYKIPSSYPSTFGDGKELLHRYRVDINLYYSEQVTLNQCNKYIVLIKKTFIQNGFIFTNGPSELFDLDNPYRGFNLEFLYIG